MSVDLAGLECEVLEQAGRPKGLWSCYANATAGGRTEVAEEWLPRLCNACRAYHVWNLLDEALDECDRATP
jgi:hypothetical protein